MAVKFLGVSRVWNEVKYDLKGEHEYDAPVSTITSYGFYSRNPNTVRFLEVISLLESIDFPPSSYMDIRASVGVHGWQNVSFVNQMGGEVSCYQCEALALHTGPCRILFYTRI